VTFGLTPAEQRLRVVEGYLADLPPLPGPELPRATRLALTRAKLALCEGLEGEEREHELQVWHDHLDGLSEHDRDAALYALKCFSQILDGLSRPHEENGTP
jgi:hypothetical protein